MQHLEVSGAVRHIYIYIYIYIIRRLKVNLFSLRLKNIHGDRSYECTPSRLNVFEIGDNTACTFRSEPYSNHAMPTAAMYSQLTSYPFPAKHYEWLVNHEINVNGN